jgi:hypothetical protein
MHHDIDAGLEEGDGEETFREVLQSIASFKAERRHGAGHDDGYLEVGQRALEEKAALHHGVRAMSDDIALALPGAWRLVLFPK